MNQLIQCQWTDLNGLVQLIQSNQLNSFRSFSLVETTDITESVFSIDTSNSTDFSYIQKNYSVYNT